MQRRCIRGLTRSIEDICPSNVSMAACPSSGFWAALGCGRFPFLGQALTSDLSNRVVSCRREYPAHFNPIGDDKISIVAIVEGAEFGERPIDESDIRRLADFFVIITIGTPNLGGQVALAKPCRSGRPIHCAEVVCVPQTPLNFIFECTAVRTRGSRPATIGTDAFLG